MAYARATYLCVRTSDSAIAAAVLSRACGSPARSYGVLEVHPWALPSCVIVRIRNPGLRACARIFVQAFASTTADAFVFEWRADSSACSSTRTAKAGRAQTASLLTHAAIIGALALLAIQSHVFQQSERCVSMSVQGHLLFAPPSDIANDHASLGHNGGGGERNPIPATHGFLAPRSSVQLAPPRLPDNATHVLAVPVTTLDENAPPIVAAVPQLGCHGCRTIRIQRAPARTAESAAGTDGGMGDNSGGDAGEGESGAPYSRGMTMPVCVTCPYPLYTDEARKVKMQGTVTLRVLVGTDGRAAQIHVARGVGYGLDERAVEIGARMEVRASARCGAAGCAGVDHD